MIDELVAEGATKTGLPQPKVRLALACALGLLDKHASNAKLRELYEAVPGAEAIARSAEAEPKRGGGLFGGLMRSAGGVSGAATADAMGALNRIQKDGVSKDQLKVLMRLAIDRVRERTGKDLLREVVESVPGVGALIAGR
jgi:hypothetical protein